MRCGPFSESLLLSETGTPNLR